MRPTLVWAVFTKELTETLRDRRSLFMLVVLPVLLYPMLLLGFTRVVKTQTAAREARQSVVAVWGPAPGDRRAGREALDARPGAGLPPALARDLADGALAPPGKDEADPLAAAARAAIQGDADVVVVAWPGLAERLAGGDVATLTVYHDSVDEDSRHARERVERALEDWRAGLVRARLLERGLPAGFARGVEVVTANVASEDRRAGQRLGAILPFVLIVMSLMGGFYASIDLTAGEKERGTMQTLLCAPVLPTEVIAGKFLTVWAMTLLAGLANIGSIAATLWRVLPGDPLGVGPGALVAAFLLFLPVSFTTSACFLAVGAFARDFKDGQNFITPVYLLLSIPSGFTLLPGVELSAWTAFVPVLNIALLIKGLLLGDATPDLVFLTLVSSALYAALALALAARVFQREEVLLGGHEPLWVTLGLERRRGQTPSPVMALVFFAVAAVVMFYGSLALERRGLVTTLLGVQLGFMLAPTLAWVAAFGLDPARTLSLRLPSARAALGAVLVGASAWAVVAGLVLRLTPRMPDSLVEGLKEVVLLGREPGGVTLALALAVVALAPGVCEELLFRGLVLSGLRKLGPWRGVLLTALLFGLAHASVHRLLPTALLGVAFGFLVLRSGSILTGMLAHGLNNGVAVVLVHTPAAAAWLGAEDPTAPLPWSVTAAGVAVCALGLWLGSAGPGREGEG
ncbi:MAG: ABC transporter permease subunit [Planctomycetes bacterium]|nr:ABC transporter permease subunit [Planctomycetota bacterium]